ncbi:siroheme synthase CysG [Methylovirgula sp. HY1]|uniref:siroheme synthase CysG n=1 Tax=Methylovirgula sp. HY1 TaxID=2822761 RepID=UPI0021058AAF|nr:siroheme synthase CysG [Methylovirgula sp. HY1]
MSDIDEDGRDRRQKEPMRGLASLPVFFDLAGRRALLAGGTARAAWKAELLQAAGAQVDVFCAPPGAELSALAESCPSVRLVLRHWRPEDFQGATLAIGDFQTAPEAAAFHAAARLARTPVNLIDRPELCDFQIGTIIDRSPLVIGISTKGASPVFALVLRGWLEALLPQAVKLWAGAAEVWRAKLKTRALSPRRQRRFWEVFVGKALGGHPPEAVDFDTLLAAAESADTHHHGGHESASQGSVALVGAGPGDPELITLKALRVLQAADVVLYDDLVAPQIINMARREAEKIAVGKRGYRPSCKQDDIVAQLVALAQEGKRVVRLKGGDPSIFGRANEEIAALTTAGIPVEIVAGITAASGAAASLKLSLTERERARRIQFITAHAHDGRLPEDIDWSSVCDPRAATAVYMGLRTLEALSQRLLAQGIDPSTPAVLVERATCIDERRVFGTIADLPAKAAAAAPNGPCLVLIGHAFDHAAAVAAKEDDARVRALGS